jgi:carboxymethylenebutenolidase
LDQGRFVKLRTADGHELAAYEAKPAGRTAGALVLLQEIFGLTSHIRSVCDRYGSQGYHTVAPALFDRVQPGVELGYSKSDASTGRELRAKISWPQTFADVMAAQGHVAGSGKIASIGYCWGGTVSWRVATQLAGFAASVCYYPTQALPYVAERPRCPVLMHFGERDPIATLDHAMAFRAAQTNNVNVHIYNAGHGFNCDDSIEYEPASAQLAVQRSLTFLQEHLGSGMVES